MLGVCSRIACESVLVPLLLLAGVEQAPHYARDEVVAGGQHGHVVFGSLQYMHEVKQLRARVVRALSAHAQPGCYHLICGGC